MRFRNFEQMYGLIVNVGVNTCSNNHSIFLILVAGNWHSGRESTPGSVVKIPSLYLYKTFMIKILNLDKNIQIFKGKC